MDVPEYLGRYKICELIAKGGMASIYRASDKLIGRDVAIKVTDTSDESWKDIKPESILRQFEMEAQISGQLSHHNFVTIYDAGKEGPLCYLVMELLDGATLSQIIKKNEPKLDMRQKLDALIQVARALHYAHQHGIIHRDIKPSNIMILPGGQVKMMDFGVALVSEGSMIKLSDEQINAIGGTPYYMSPEQVGKKDVDARSDLFSLAVVSYELLTGRRPFMAEHLFNLYEKILRTSPLPIQELNASIPGKVAAVISICMNKEPDLRLLSCKTFADQLDEILNDSFFEAEGEAITEELIKLLRKYREAFTFFLDLDNSQIYKLLQVCQVRKFEKDEVICYEGDVAREMYLVVSGEVRIVRGQVEESPIVITVFKRGDILGEMGIIDGGPRSATAIASSRCQMLVLHQVSLLRCDDITAGKIYRNLSHILSNKLRITSQRLDDLSRRLEV